jgi:hypothetical protein
MTQVNLSSETQFILENFALINSSIVFKKGNVIKTIANAENILAEYVCEEYFPRDFAIYDLSQFLAGIRILDNPSLIFDNDDYVILKGRNASLKYYFSDPQITLKVAPEKQVKFPGSNIEFDIAADLQNKISNISLKFKLEDMTFQSKDDHVSILLTDRENDTSNSCKFDMTSGTCTGDYDLNMRVENYRVIEGSYKVRVSEALLSEWVFTGPGEGRSRFLPKDLNLKYFIALEPK